MVDCLREMCLISDNATNDKFFVTQFSSLEFEKKKLQLDMCQIGRIFLPSFGSTFNKMSFLLREVKKISFFCRISRISDSSTQSPNLTKKRSLHVSRNLRIILFPFVSNVCNKKRWVLNDGSGQISPWFCSCFQHA